MKKNDLQKMLGLIDDDILNEARPSGKRAKSKTALWLKIVSAAACFLLVLNVAFLPALMIMNGKISGLTSELEGKNQLIDNILNGGNASPDTAPEGTDKNPPHVQNVLEITLGKNNDKTVLLSSPLLSAPSKYNDIINSMIGVNGSLNSPSDTDDKLEDAMDQESSKNENLEDAGGNLDESEGDEYHETTDSQVNGVIEGDIIKRSSKYIYYLSGSKLKIYSINRENSELVGLFSLDKYVEAINAALEIPEQLTNDDVLEEEKEEILDREEYYSPTVKEMFLSIDLKTVTVVLENRANTANLNRDGALWCTTLISLNVEDPNGIYLNGITTLFGRYESARLLNGEFLVFTRHTPTVNELIIPQYNDGEGFEYIPRENIYSPNEYKKCDYLVSYRINGDSYKVSDVYAYASYDGDIYVTENSIYVTCQYQDVTKIISEYPVYLKDVPGNSDADPNIILGYGTKTVTYQKTATNILRVDISSGKFSPVGEIMVEGYLKDRYSLHENGEYFYAVTTDSPLRTYVTYKNDFGARAPLRDLAPDEGTSANLFVIDNETMALISSVKRFAPSGETVRSVRFDGDLAYVCTAILNTDPVFFFNLSDPYNITYSDTGTIPGFSTSLIELPSGELLGIGTDGDGYVKLEVYRMGENNTVVIVDTIKIKATSYSTDYKTYFIDRENGYFGLGYRDWRREDGETERYALVKYENGYFKLVFDCALSGTLESKRAVMIDGYFYMLSSKEFEVVKIS